MAKNDINSGKILCRHVSDFKDTFGGGGPGGAIITTASGLVINPSPDGFLNIHDAANGKILFQTRFSTPPTGFPVTYMAGSRQYLAVSTAGGRNAIQVFALPAGASR